LEHISKASKLAHLKTGTIETVNLRALRGGCVFFLQKASRIMPTKTQTAAKTKPNKKAATPSTRDNLIGVGLELMRKHGYGATGVQEILKAAGVPKGSFYHHFASKEEFAAAVVERYVHLEGEHCQEVLGNTSQAPLRRLRRYFEDLIRTAGQSAPIQGCLMGTLSLEIAGASSLLQACLSSNFAYWEAIIASVLREAIENDELPKSTKPEALAGFVLNGWEGALLRSQADRSDAPLKDFLHYMFEGFLINK
jgi:TetR/AcrR family transcriptional repressor of nem operon